MEKIDAKQVKEKILQFLEIRGPSLPIQVAKSINLNTIFTSAFLSELSSDGLIKISSMKVGGSPLYYIPSKQYMLENFISYLSPKEREACELLKEKRFLNDSEQHPAIRVALRSLKDFAIQIRNSDRLFWRYFLESGEIKEKEKEQARETIEIIKQKETPDKEELKPNQEQKSAPEPKIESREDLIEKMRLELLEKKEQLEKARREIEIKLQKRKKAQKKVQKIDDVFLNQIKPILEQKEIEIINIEEFDKRQVIARVKKQNSGYLLIALNKKKLEDEELVKLDKKYSNLNLPYLLFLKGDLPKRTKEIIDAHKKLESVEKMG